MEPKPTDRHPADAEDGDRFVRRYLKTRHLVLLVELGRHWSVVKAARAANMTQPSASMLIAELERALGVSLFERLHRGMKPTIYGNILIRRAGASLAEIEAGLAEFMQMGSDLRGDVSVGAIPTPSASLLPAAIALMKSRHPCVTIAAQVDGSETLGRRLLSGELDFYIGRVTELHADAEFQFEPIAEERFHLVGRAGHPLLQRPNARLKDLVRYGWIMPPEGSCLHDAIDALFLSKGCELPAETVTTTAPSVIVSLLAATGDMVAPMAFEAVRPWVDRGILATLPFNLNVKAGVYGIVTRRNGCLMPAAEVLLHALRETVSNSSLKPA